jgi:hypothetical protein
MGDFYLDLVKTVDKMVETILGVDKIVGLDKLLGVDKKVGLDKLLGVDKKVGLDKLLGVKDLKLVDMEDAISSIVQESV